MFNRFIGFALAAGLVGSAGAAIAADSAPAPRAVVVVAPGPQASGDVYGSIGVFGASGVTPGVTLLEFNGGGRGNVPLGMGSWNFEGQVNASAFYQTGASGGTTSQDLAATAHLWNRMPNAAIGGLVSWSTGITSILGTSTSVGGEFKVFAPRASFGAGAAVTFYDFLGLINETTWTLNASGNFYLNPNLGFGLHGAFTHLDLFGVDAWELGGGAEMRLGGTPATLFLDVTRASGLDDGWRSRLGARFQIDAPKSTLQSHDRDVPFDWVVPKLIPIL